MGKIEFKLPDIGEGVAEGEIVAWKVEAGEAVTEDQIMVEVMTDKATVEIGAPVTGRIAEIRAAEGETINVGEVIVVLEDSAESSAPAETEAETAAAATGAEPPAKQAKAKQGAAKKGAGKQASAPAPAAAASGDDGDDDYEEINFTLPDIGEGVAEGEVTQWHVKAGDAVKEDQVMVEVMTDKATVEIGSPVDGKVLELLVEEGQTVPVGEILLVLGSTSGAPKMHAEASASAPTTAKAAGGKAASSASGGGATATAAPPATLPDTGLPDRADGTRRVRAAPATRRLAREQGIDIATLAGSGPNGRILIADVKAASGTGPATTPSAPRGKSAPKPSAAKPAAKPARKAAPKAAPLTGDERVPLRGLRKRIAAQMRVAKDTAAHFTYVEELDVTELVKLRRAAKAKGEAAGVKITYMPFIIKALVPALRDFPLVNSSLDEEAGEIVYHHDLNIGIAVDTEGGLIVPVVRAVDTKSLVELAGEIGDLAERGREGKQRQEDFGGGTFTITNAGNIGGMLATPIINVPEVAILGVHAIKQRPWVVDGEIVVRDIMLLSISLDHRVVDGAVGARFMNRVKELLENPALLLLEEI